MVVLVQLAERQIVALEVKGSTPLDHPIFYYYHCFTRNLANILPVQLILGCRQVVRHWILTPTLRRFESYHPSQMLDKLLGCRQVVRHKILILAFVGSNPATPANFLWSTSSAGRALDF